MVHIVGQIEFDCDIEALSEEIEKAGYVKVVRCKDCRYCESECYGYCFCFKRNQLMHEDEYCSRGERREPDEH